MKITRFIFGSIETGAAFGAGYFYAQSSYWIVIACIAASIVAGAVCAMAQQEITLAKAGHIR